MRLDNAILVLLLALLVVLVYDWFNIPDLPVKPIGGTISEQQSVDFLREIRDSFIEGK